MKRKLIAILLTMTFILILTACGQSDSMDDADVLTDEELENEEVIDPEVEEVTTIDSVMESLLEDGEYTKEGDSYVWESKEDDVNAKYIFTVDGNVVNMKGILDYGSDNKEMIRSFKEDPESIDTIPADFLMDFASLANAEDSVMNYAIYVGDEKVIEDKMTYKEANEVLSDIDD